MKRFLLLAICSIPFATIAQNAKVVPTDATVSARQASFRKSEWHTTPLAAFIDPKEVKSNWKLKVSHIARTHGGPNRPLLEDMKRAKTASKVSSAEGEIASAAAVTPQLGINFLGNEMFDGTPPDNSFAISNGGKAVSADNATLEIYDVYASDPYLSYWVSHYDFFADNLNPAPNASIYDPRVIYDSGADRFVFCILNGSSSNESEILLCFSKTNNPMDGWWVYRFAANEGHPNLWFDYPNLGVSNNEVYVSGNMFTDGGNFQGNVLFQIPKQVGYDGQQLGYQYWTDITDTDQNLGFTIMPLSHGRQGNYGPGIYLAATESNTTNNSVFFFDLTNDASANDETINVYEVSTSNFEIGGNAAQSGSNAVLDVGDSRMQSGFYYNGTAHFVHTTDIGGGWNGIRYSRINASDLSITSSNFGNQGQFDYAYPSVAAFATGQNDNSVMMSFLASNGSSFPHIRAVNCDNNLNWSSSTIVKAGESAVAIQGGASERWGDYSTISRKHNGSSPEVWLAGCYGAANNHWQVPQGYNAWIGQILAGPAGVTDVAEAAKLQVYPNPTVDMFTIDFSVPERQQVQIDISDISGKLVRHLFTDHVKAGTNRLTFNRGALPAGQFIISITSNNKTITHEKLIIQ